MALVACAQCNEQVEEGALRLRVVISSTSFAASVTTTTRWYCVDCNAAQDVIEEVKAAATPGYRTLRDLLRGFKLGDRVQVTNVRVPGYSLLGTVIFATHETVTVLFDNGCKRVLLRP